MSIEHTCTVLYTPLGLTVRYKSIYDVTGRLTFDRFEFLANDLFGNVGCHWRLLQKR